MSRTFLKDTVFYGSFKDKEIRFFSIQNLKSKNVLF